MSSSNFNVMGGPLGNQQISANNLPDTVQRHQAGVLVKGVSPYWGGAELLYARFNGTVRQYGLCTILSSVVSGALQHNMTEVANTANLGAPLFVALTSGIVGQFGWFLYSGVVPINSNASVATDTALGIAAAGQAGAQTAGKQILSARCVLPATTTVVKTVAYGQSGQSTIQVSNSDGLFMGAYLSGTGVGSGATITDISPDGLTLTVSVANTAAISGSLTATYNNGTVYYNVVRLLSPCAQGAIT